MAATDNAARIAPLIEQLLDDENARRNLRRGADKLHDAYRRSQKRRVKVARDKKLRRQLKSAARSIGNGADALMAGAQRPKKRHRMRKLLTVGVVGAGVALALNEDLRSSIFGSGSSPEQTNDGAMS